jgi:hypothetical protein
VRRGICSEPLGGSFRLRLEPAATLAPEKRAKMEQRRHFALLDRPLSLDALSQLRYAEFDVPGP